MRVYSLSNGDNDFLGFEDDGTIIDLTRAISFYEITVASCSNPPVRYIEEMITENKLSVDFLGEVMSVLSKHGVKNDFAVNVDYEINAPLYPGKIIALGQNYLEHIKEMNGTVPDKPVLFGKWPSTVIGHLDSIIKKSLPSTNVEQRYADYTRRLRERYLKSMEAKKAGILALEAEAGGTSAELAKLDEQGIEPSIQLREIFIQKSQRRPELRR